MATPRMVIAEFAYEDSGQGLLQLKAGQKLKLLKETGNGWAEGETSNGKHGFFPVSFVRDLPAEETAAAPAEDDKIEAEAEKPAVKVAEPTPSAELPSEDDDAKKKKKKLSSSKKLTGSQALKDKKSSKEKSGSVKDKEKKKKKSKSKTAKSNKKTKCRYSVFEAAASTREETTREANIAWARDTLKIEEDSSASDIHDALLEKLQFPEETSTFLDNSEKLNGLLDAYYASGTSMEEGDLNLLKKLCSMREMWLETFDQSLFEDQQRVSDAYSTASTATEDQLKATQNLKKVAARIQQCLRFGMDTSTAMKDFVSQLPPEVELKVESPFAASDALDTRIEQLQSKRQAVNFYNNILEQLAEDGPAVGACHATLTHCLEYSVAAAIALTSLTGDVSMPDAAGADGSNSLFREQVLPLLHVSYPLHETLSVPVYALVSKIACRYESSIGGILGPHAFVQEVAACFINAVSQQLKKMSVAGATFSGVSMALRVLTAIANDSIDLSCTIMPQVMNAACGLVSTNSEVSVTAGDKSLMEIKLIPKFELQENVLSRIQAVQDGVESPEPVKTPHWPESSLFESSAWQVQYKTGVTLSLVAPEQGRDVKTYGYRNAPAWFESCLLSNGWCEQPIQSSSVMDLAVSAVAPEEPAARAVAVDDGAIDSLKERVTSLQSDVGNANTKLKEMTDSNMPERLDGFSIEVAALASSLKEMQLCLSDLKVQSEKDQHEIQTIGGQVYKLLLGLKSKKDSQPHITRSAATPAAAAPPLAAEEHVQVAKPVPVVAPVEIVSEETVQEPEAESKDQDVATEEEDEVTDEEEQEAAAVEPVTVQKGVVEEVQVASEEEDDDNGTEEMEVLSEEEDDMEFVDEDDTPPASIPPPENMTPVVKAVEEDDNEWFSDEELEPLE